MVSRAWWIRTSARKVFSVFWVWGIEYGAAPSRSEASRDHNKWVGHRGHNTDRRNWSCGIFSAYVIEGVQSFVEKAPNFKAYEQAMVRKLTRELTVLVLSRR
jgi:hypothetical protein